MSGVFGQSIADRLKAAVNTLEATGSSLQAQAQARSAQQQSQQQSNGVTANANAGPSTITISKDVQNSASASEADLSKSEVIPRPTSTTALNDAGANLDRRSSLPTRSTTGPTGTGTISAAGPSSPSKNTGNYILQAGDAINGFRKSFHFGRPSLDVTRSPTTPTTSDPLSGHQGPQELKDIPSSPAPNAKLNDNVRPSSPAKFLNTQFQLGSDPSSMAGSPHPDSPNPESIPLPRSPFNPEATRAEGIPRISSEVALDGPGVTDPANLPLPLSPESSLILTVPSSASFGDPLGASPILAAQPVPNEPAAKAEPVEGVAQEAQSIVQPSETAVGTSKEADEKAVEVNDTNPAVGLGIQGAEDKGQEDGEKSEKGSSAPSIGDTSGEVERVKKELADTERRYEDLSQRFTTLLTQKHNADKILKDLTPLEGGIGDHEALEGWVRMMNGKVEMITEEMKRLQGKITLQESRIEELRDTHRLEGSSQGELITKLRSQLSTAESNVASKTSELSSLSTLKADLSKAQTQAKEEEEKRTKAISLLKTVRMKLVKVEKEKDEIERDRAEERAERSTARDELERYRSEREREVTNLRRGFEKELAGAKDKYEKEIQSKKAAWELELITTKASHAKELSGKSTKVSGLEAIVKELNLSKQKQFEDSQSLQAESEANLAELEGLRTRTKELEFQLREVNERCALLEDSNSNSNNTAGPSMDRDRGRNLLSVNGSGSYGGRSATPSPTRGGSSSPMEVQRLIAEAESRSEAKVSDLKYKIRMLEKERNDSEEEWAKKLGERVKELERLKRNIQEKDSEYADSLRTRKEKEKLIEEGAEARKALDREIRGLRAQLEEAREDIEAAMDAERIAKEELSVLKSQMSDLNAQLEDSKTYGTNLKSANKQLRDELRKVQSSVQLLERQRGPGVGYWSNANAGASSSSSALPSSMPSPGLGNTRTSTPSIRSGAGPNGGTNVDTDSTTDTATVDSASTSIPTKGRPSLESTQSSMRRIDRMGSGDASVGSSGEVRDKEEEEVNLEYLRNVILQFLEHKEMRPNLVRVLSVILRFTPQELRRLNAKLQT